MLGGEPGHHGYARAFAVVEEPAGAQASLVNEESMRPACIPAQAVFGGRPRIAAEASVVKQQHGQPRPGERRAQRAVACVAAGHQHGHTATGFLRRDEPCAQLQAITGLPGSRPPRHQLGGTPCP